MATTLTYGKATTCLLESLDAVHFRPNQTAVIPDREIAERIRSQLENPINYPPLSQATIPDDRVVLTVEPATPQLVPILDGVLQGLAHAGVDSKHITILLAAPFSDPEKLDADLGEKGHGRCQVKLHDPDNDKEIALLGVSQEGHALRLNRELCEADLVLPISVTVGQVGPNSVLPSCSGLFPTFSDRQTINHFFTSSAQHFPAISQQNKAEVEDCLRQLGLGISLHVVPGGVDQVAAIFVGEPSAANVEALQAYRAVWNNSIQTRANLVIATLTGASEQQTWENLGRALRAAEAVLEVDGAIVLCTELAEPPGPALGLLAENEDPALIEREILSSPSRDSGPALLLCHTLQKSNVYLRSKLRSPFVESLGITPIETDSELERLAQAIRPCVVLEEAHRLLPSFSESEEESI